MTLTAWLLGIVGFIVALVLPDWAERAHRRSHLKECERCNPRLDHHEDRWTHNWRHKR